MSMHEIEIQGDYQHPATGRSYPWSATYLTRGCEVEVRLTVTLTQERKTFQDRRVISFDEAASSASSAVVDYAKKLITDYWVK